MDNKEIRRENLLALIKQFGSAAAVAEITETPDTYIVNIKNGVRGMGDEVARRIERRLEKPRGWMDATHNPAADSVAEELMRDYHHATPEWQLTLRLLAKVSPDRQAELATALNKLLAGGVQDGLSGNLDRRTPFFNSRLGDKKHQKKGRS